MRKHKLQSRAQVLDAVEWFCTRLRNGCKVDLRLYELYQRLMSAHMDLTERRCYVNTSHLLFPLYEQPTLFQYAKACALMRTIEIVSTIAPELPLLQDLQAIVFEYHDLRPAILTDLIALIERSKHTAWAWIPMSWWYNNSICDGDPWYENLTVSGILHRVLFDEQQK